MFWLAVAVTMALVSSLKMPIRRCVYLSTISSNRVAFLRSYSISASQSETNRWNILCSTPEDIEAVGCKLAAIVGNGDVILLKGDLGAGKTTFSRGLIRAKFEDDSMRVTSPSYLLDNTYEYDEGQYIHHMDLYRLPTGCDLSILDIPGIYSSSLCLIEWPQRMGPNLPEEFLEVDIGIEKDETRNIRFVAVGEIWIERMKSFLN